MIIFDIKYTINHRSEVVRNVVFNGLRLRESDGFCILSLQSMETRKSFTVEVGRIDWISIDGRIRRLRTPRDQSAQREAELKYLLQGKRDGINDPSMKSYKTDEIMPFVMPRRGVFGWILSIIIFIFLSIPGLATLGILGVALYIAYIMMNNVR